MISNVYTCTTWNLCEDIIVHYTRTTWLYDISTIWFQDSTPAQPEIFVDDMILHYTRTTWLSLYSYNLVTGFYTCTTWNLYLYCKMIYFTLHSHTLIFITFAKYDFPGFFILIVCLCFLIYTYFVIIFMSTRCRCRTLRSLGLIVINCTERWRELYLWLTQKFCTININKKMGRKVHWYLTGKVLIPYIHWLRL